MKRRVFYLSLLAGIFAASGMGASVSAKTVISEAGTYTLSGIYDSKVVVELPEDASAELILDHARILSKGHGIRIRSGKKVTLRLAEGSENYIFTDDKAAISCSTDLEICGSGSLYIESNKKGITSDKSISFTEGELTVARCTEGMEAAFILISGGRISIRAQDDGLNAAFGKKEGVTWELHETDPYVRFEGGETVILADEDGIDSNGDIFFGGGTVLVNGSGSSTSSAVDADGRIWMEGGILVAAGAQGMDRCPADKGQQAVHVCGGWEPGGSILSFYDENEQEILAFQTVHDWNSLIYSFPEEYGEVYYEVTEEGRGSE